MLEDEGGEAEPGAYLYGKGAHCALCARCVKSRLFSANGSHGSQGPEFCTPGCFKLIMHACVGG